MGYTLERLAERLSRPPDPTHTPEACPNIGKEYWEAKHYVDYDSPDGGRVVCYLCGGAWTFVGIDIPRHPGPNSAG
jgi:hypothetical protein